MHLETWLAFLGASALLLVLPGPTILTVISYSITHGRRAACRWCWPWRWAIPPRCFCLWSAWARCCRPRRSGSPWSRPWAACTCCTWASLLRAGVAPATLPQAGEAGSRWKLFANTYLVTALNPKGIIFFVAFLPQFIDPAGDTVRQMWILSATFVTCAGLNAAAYALFAGQARRLLASPRARFNLGGGALLSAAGVWALLARRA